jgi:mRNA interferase MazF
MKRGEIWTVSGGGDYTGKPRPVVVVQDDLFSETNSVTVCPFTSDPTDLPLIRIAIDPTETTGLRAPSRIMADKLTTVPKSKLGTRIGRLSDRDVLRLNRAVLVFLGLAR